MQIVKKDSFRSQGAAINKTDDMYRVVVDMRRTEYSQFAKLVEGQKPTTNTQSTAELNRVRIVCAQIAVLIGRETCALSSYLPERLRVMFRDCAQQLRTL